MNPYEYYDDDTYVHTGSRGRRERRTISLGYSSPAYDHMGHCPGPRGGAKGSKKRRKMAKESRRRNRR